MKGDVKVMAKRGSLGNSFQSLPWILRVLLAIFLDCVLGIIRLVDGIIEGNVLKVILGILWVFYGLGIGWILDIIFTLFNMRPLFM